MSEKIITNLCLKKFPYLGQFNLTISTLLFPLYDNDFKNTAKLLSDEILLQMTLFKLIYIELCILFAKMVSETQKNTQKNNNKKQTPIQTT